MRKSWPILLPPLLLLSGCGSEGATDSDEVAAAPEQPALDLPVADAGADEARLQDIVRRAMASALPDAAGARYRNLRAGVGGAACGDVAAGTGPFRPFVVTPDTLAVIASGPAIAFDDPSDFFADAWIRWCATPEELERLGPQLRSAAGRAPPDAAASAPPPLDLPPPDPAGPALRPAPKPPAKAPAEPPRIDSFFNSVQRE